MAPEDPVEGRPGVGLPLRGKRRRQGTGSTHGSGRLRVGEGRRSSEGVAVSETTDPTFYRSPRDAMAAPPESLAYVAAFDPSSRAKDAITVIDCDAASATFGQVVGWSELPTAGNELHHFGWNACSSALCHAGHADGSLERR